MSCYVVLCCVVFCCVVFLPVRTNSHIFCHNGAKTILLYITNFSLLTAAGHPRRGGSVTERTSPLPERSISIKGERFGRELVALQLMSKQLETTKDTNQDSGFVRPFGKGHRTE